MKTRTACAGALAFAFAAVVASSCSDPGIDDLFPSSAAAGGGTGAAGGSGGSGAAGGGTGGQGAAPAGCDDCSGATPICVDGDHCAAACPGGRVACDTAGDSGPTGCCGEGEQCCSAAANGYPGHDLCHPVAEPCPVVCPDGVTTCPTDQYCAIDPDTGTYGCTADCAGNSICGNLCCPLGSSCTNGACPLADLTVDVGQLQSSAEIIVKTFAADACEIFEGCIAAPGQRTLLHFDLKTPNVGDGNLHLGDPTGNPLFQFSQCHGHYHFNGYANYHLLNDSGQEIGSGHKQAFCLLDLTQVDPNASPDAIYSCGYQGIQAGWADVYNRNLPCQWVDVTDVPAGTYTLQVEVNRDHQLAESNYANNVAAVTVTIPASSCPNGCRGPDPVCCQPGDPCGWGADGSCDCAGFFDWDMADCSSCASGDPDCDFSNTCPGGCTENTGACCADGDPCSLQNNGTCDCGGAFGWDTGDCISCETPDPDCPVNSCPNGCTAYNPANNCCGDTNPCNWDGDGWCDCGGAAWDAVDCATCISNDPDCP
jgi:hypothetical protein